MIRVAVVADSHFDETSRFEECIRIHAWIAEQVRERKVDLVLHSGDVFERKSTPAERNAVAAWLLEVAEHCPVVVVRGNHDAVGDLQVFGKLAGRHEIIVAESASVERVRLSIMGPDDAYVDVACLPWPRKAELLAASGTQGQEAQQLAQEALRAVLRGMGAEMADALPPPIPGSWAEPPRGPRILLAHALVTGSMTSTGQPLVGHEMELDLSDLALAQADFYALGHIHLAQHWTIGGAPVVFPGSPRRTSFGETETKGFLVADFEETACSSWEVVETPCTQMILAEDEWAQTPEGGYRWRGGWADIGAPVGGSEIRLRYRVASDQRDAARAAVERERQALLDMGAAAVKVEEVVRAVKRAKAPEVALARSLPDKLSAFWASRGTTPDAERRARLMAKLGQIETEASNAA